MLLMLLLLLLLLLRPIRYSWDSHRISRAAKVMYMAAVCVFRILGAKTSRWNRFWAIDMKSDKGSGAGSGLLQT